MCIAFDSIQKYPSITEQILGSDLFRAKYLENFLNIAVALFVRTLKLGRCNENFYSLRPNLDGYSYSNLFKITIS